MNPTTLAMLSSGQWIDQDTLTDIASMATEQWDAAAIDDGEWRMRVDVADLSKICTELLTRRAAES